MPPAAKDESAAESAADGTVLVVGDICVSMPEQLGYETYAVSDASAARHLIEKKNFDIVVSGIMMPGALDGAALANAIQARKPQLPMPVATDYSLLPAPRELRALRISRKNKIPCCLGHKASSSLLLAQKEAASGEVPMRYFAPAVLTMLLLVPSSFWSRAAIADDAAPKATATRPAKDLPGQSSLPNAAPPATTTQTTGSVSQDPKIKQMNEEGKQKVEKEGK